MVDGNPEQIFEKLRERKYIDMERSSHVDGKRRIFAHNIPPAVSAKTCEIDRLTVDFLGLDSRVP